MSDSLGALKFRSMLLVSSVEMFLSVAVLLTDTIIAGRAAGESGVAAMNIMTPVVSTLAFIGRVISVGVSFCWGSAIGNLDKKRADGLFGMSVILSILAGVIAFTVMVLCSESYFAFLNPKPEVLTLARDYLSFYKFVLLLDPLAMLFTTMVYNDGDELIASIANFANVFGNIILSLFFALFMKMGMSGIALGTLAKNVISLAVLSCHFLRRTNSLHARIYFSLNDFLVVMRYGFVDSGMYLMWGMLLFVMNKFVIAEFGGEFLPVLSMAVSVLEVSILFDGTAQAMLPLVSVYYAEGNYPAVRKVMRPAVKVSVIEGVIASLVLYVSAPLLPSLFGIDSPEITGECVSAVRIISLTLAVSSLLYLFETYYMIQEKNMLAVISSCLRNLVCILALALPLGQAFGLCGVWAAFSLSQVMTLALCAFLACMKWGRENFPMYLDDKKPIADFDLTVSPENVMSTRDEAEAFMRANSVHEDDINRAMLLIKETGMMILERNAGKNIHAEYTLNVRDDKTVRIIVRDDGEIFDVTDDDMEITSLRSYFIAGLMSIEKYRQNITTTSFNRNVFNVLQKK